MPKPEKSLSFAPEELAQRLSASAQKLITPEQAVEIAETGNLISEDGTVDLVKYIAYLAGEFSNDAE